MGCGGLKNGGQSPLVDARLECSGIDRFSAFCEDVFVDSKRIFLSEKELPTAWYNLQADLPTPLPPPLHPGTKQPLSPADLEPIFAKALIAQEMSRERWIEIPEPVREVYKIWRPTPLVRATNLEKALKTPARIYYKDESVSPPGSHKPNSAVPQAYYNKIEGIEHLATETGAGQWGSSLAFACAFFNMHCKVFMVKVSYHQKPYRRSMMHLWGATRHAESFGGDQRRPAASGRRSRKPRQPGHGHQRGGRGGRHARRHEIHARQRAEPRHAASVGDRSGSREAVRAGRRFSRRRARLRRRRQQLRRHLVPVHSPQAGRQEHPFRGLRAAFVPVDEPRRSIATISATRRN